ncbi:hypothetical protein ACHAWC_011411 [Mediolabrus comicus]
MRLLLDRTLLLTIALGLCLVHKCCLGFSPSGKHSGSTRSRLPQSHHAAQNNSNDKDNNDDDASATTLNLYGEATIQSEVVPPPHEKIHEFFALPGSALLLLRGSKNNDIIEITNADKQLRDAYQEQCRKVNANISTSDHNERFFEVTTSGVNFPGLQIMSLATIGAKVVKEGHAGFPAYEFVLVRDSTYAKGNRLFVWFFNKITNKDDIDDSNRDQTTQSLNILRVLPLDDGSIAFECNANLSISVKVPAVLMKIIPNKEKAESTGGESLVATLQKDIPTALSAFRDSYIKWRDSN